MIKKFRGGFTVVEFLIVVAVVGIIAMVVVGLFGGSSAEASEKGCGGFWEPDCRSEGTYAGDIQALVSQQQALNASVPVPKFETSQERKNIARRLETFNKEDKISYIYLVNYGKVMAFYTVQGKVSNVSSYLTPSEMLVRDNGKPCSSGYTCYSVEAPDNDGSYGTNGDAIFFFTTEGAYVEWKGDYMVSDQPLKLTTTPELVRQVQ